MSEIDHRAIGLRLAQMRWRLQIDTREAARRAGVSPRSWRKWEAGAPMQTGSVLKVCSAFHCSIDWFVDGDRRRAA
jgi:DNA-binding transcriptional regulator YiaG